MVYSQVGGNWVSDGTISAGNRHSGDELGKAVAIEGETAVIGAPGIWSSSE